MKLETWVALASLGLSVMFAVLIISLYSFLIGPQGQGPERVVDPGGLLIQQVSISAAPAIILAGVVFAMDRSTGNRQAGLILVAAGAVMVAGMLYSAGLVPQIARQYAVGGIPAVPYVFAAAGAAVAGMGAYLVVASRKARSIGNLDDLR